MATGASTADVAILLVDARNGVRVQSRRHARIARLLGITDFVAGGQQDGPRRLRPRGLRAHRGGVRRHPAERRRRARHPDERAERRQRHHHQRAHAVVRRAAAARVSRDGARCTATCRRSRSASRCSWWCVPTTCSAAMPDRSSPARCASATASRPGPRAAAPASSASSPATATSTMAFAPMSVTLTLDDEIDISRGDMLTIEPAFVGQQFEAEVVWMDERPLDPGRVYLLKHSTRTVTAEVNHGAGAQPDRHRRRSRRHGRWCSTATPTTAAPAASS